MGHSAAGKKTFIDQVVSNQNTMLMERLGYGSGKIIAVGNDVWFDAHERFMIKEIVLDIIDKEENVIILIKWQFFDTDTKYGYLVKDMYETIPNAAHEIVVLAVEDDVLYGRLAQRPWWKEENGFTRERMQYGIKKLGDDVAKCLQMGIRLAAEIDTTDGYVIMKGDM
jgi:hypothetical protein